MVDLLAKLGAEGVSQCFTSIDLPMYACGLVQPDRLGVVYLHK